MIRKLPLPTRLSQVVAGQELTALSLPPTIRTRTMNWWAGLLAFFFQLLAYVAIVLLIRPVKLEHGRRVFA